MSSLVLPWPAIYSILDNLSDLDLINACRVSKSLRAYCQSNSYWRHRIATRFEGLKGVKRNPQLWYQRLRPLLGEPPQDLSGEIISLIEEALQAGEDSIVDYLMRKYSRILMALSFKNIYGLGYLLARYNQRERLLEFLNLVDSSLAGESTRKPVLNNLLRRTLRGAIEGGHLDFVREILDVWAPRFEWNLRTPSPVTDIIPLEEGLAEAARVGNPAMVQLFLDRGATEYQGAIDQAARNGHESIVRLLLTKVPAQDLPYQKFTAMLGAASGDQVELLRKLLNETEYGRRDLNRALHEAVANGQVQVIRELLSRGADDLRAALYGATRGGDLGLFEELAPRVSQYFEDPRLLTGAVIGGNPEIVRRLMNNLWISRERLLALILLALENGRGEVFEYLLSLPQGLETFHSIDYQTLRSLLLEIPREGWRTQSLPSVNVTDVRALGGVVSLLPQSLRSRGVASLLPLIAKYADKFFLESILEIGINNNRHEIIQWALNNGARDLRRAVQLNLSTPSRIFNLRPRALELILREYQRLHPEDYQTLINRLLREALNYNQSQFLERVLQLNPGVQIPEDLLPSQSQQDDWSIPIFLNYLNQENFDQLMTRLILQGRDLSQILPQVEGSRIQGFIQRARAAGREDLVQGLE